MSDKPVLHTPGELLLEAREAAGLDLHQVEARTKIPLAILRSLELDEYHKISGPLYVNSFLRTYATDVGLDPAHLLDLYMRFSGEAVGTGPVPGGEAVWVDEEVEIRRVGVPWRTVALGVGAVAVLVVLIVWLVGLRGCSSDDGGAAEGPATESIHESLLAGSPASETAEPLAAEPVPGDASVAESRGGATPVVRENPGVQPAAAAAPARNLPAMRPGTPELRFQDGAYWPVVLRLLCDKPVNAQLVRDGDRSTPKVAWLLDPAAYPPLPETGIEHGRPYATRQGLVVYWGARDQFSLKLDRTDGVRVALNGKDRDISNLQPGQEIILFVP